MICLYWNCLEALVIGALRFRWPGMRVYLEASEDYSKRSDFLGCLCLILILCFTVFFVLLDWKRFHLHYPTWDRSVL